MDKRLSNVIAICLIIVTGTCVYANSFKNPFIWDDGGLIVNNLQIRNISNIPRLFGQNVYRQDMVGRYYRPILMTSFALDYRLWGLKPFGYHLTNLLLHLANALLVFCLIQLIFGRQILAFLSALLFVLHPIHTEAVTYIAGRADPLAALFCLISLIFFIKYLNFAETSRRKFYYATSVLSFTLGLLSREAAVIFPLVFMLYEVCFRKLRIKFKDLYKYVPFFVVILFYGFVRNIVLSDVKEAYRLSDFIPVSYRLLTIPSVIVTYFRLLLFPFDLHMEHLDYMTNPVTSLFEFRSLAALLFLIVIGIFIWQSRRRSKLVLFGSLWFFLNLLPVLNIVPVNAFVAEHWLYIPSIGFFLIVSAAFIRLIGFKPIRPFAIVPLIGIFILLIFLTVKQNYIWREHIIFYKYTLRHSPQSSRLHTNLGNTYIGFKLYDEAAREYEEALRISPSGIHGIYGYMNLGVLYEHLDKEDEAIRMYEKAIELDPTFALAFNYIGKLHHRKGRYQDAIKFYRKAVELVPSNANYLENLADVYLKSKMLKEAAESYERALNIYPYLVGARINLGGIYAELGNPKRALEEYDFALRLYPDSAQIYYNIGNASAQLGDLVLAEECWKKALELDPNYVDAREKLDRLQELSY